MSTSTTDLTVRDVMLPPAKVPVADEKTILKETLELMNASRLGICCIVDADGKLKGIFTDGDIRRMLLRDQKPFPALFVDDAIDHAKTNPTTIDPDARLIDAIEVMEEKEIWDLPVVDGSGRFCGLLHLHPAIKALLGLS
jgi:arabinose-5-phosphate isomerase